MGDDFQESLEQLAQQRPDLPIELDPERRKRFNRELQELALTHLRAAASGVLKSFKNELSPDGHFVVDDNGQDILTDKTPTSFITDPSVYSKLVAEAREKLKAPQ